MNYNPAMFGMGTGQNFGMHAYPGGATMDMGTSAMSMDACCDPCCDPCCAPPPVHHCHRPQPQPQPQPQPFVYVVQRGDSVYKIARRFGTTMQAIILANNLRNPDLIFPGQTLIIPGV